MIQIDSPQNPRLKEIAKLRDRKHRDATGLFIIEESRVIKRALKKGWAPETVCWCSEKMIASDRKILSDLREFACDQLELTERAMSKIAYRNKPGGFLVIAKQKFIELADLQLPDSPLIVVLDNVEKPGNLGAVLRSASGSGVDAVLISDNGTDLFNPNTLRSSTGAFFEIPIVQCNPEELREYLKTNNIEITATTPDTDIVYTDIDMTKGIALVMGAEDVGLDINWLNSADTKVRIPMAGVADSLNVSVSSALMMYEARRQRTK
ncbi:RNA methyltransferase [bacterium]|jgi:TrmH family RNA methyltransferase|nr:RNA methyltransferase [bacterium]MBT4292065.1 RNA methyltransferase [bacterium]MBT7311452.1 RNA methyltransferase [bacterium]